MEKREIKFRAWMKIWDEDEPVKGKMFYQILPTGDLKTWIIAFDNDGKYDGDFTVGEDIELMQYTGLKDKNGKEIYEGDIVSNNEAIWEIYAKEAHYCMAVDGKRTENDHLFVGEDRNSEIIGDIYQNPELLNN